MESLSISGNLPVVQINGKIKRQNGDLKQKTDAVVAPVINGNTHSSQSIPALINGHASSPKNSPKKSPDFKTIQTQAPIAEGREKIPQIGDSALIPKDAIPEEILQQTKLVVESEVKRFLDAKGKESKGKNLKIKKVQSADLPQVQSQEKEIKDTDRDTSIKKTKSTDIPKVKQPPIDRSIKKAQSTSELPKHNTSLKSQLFQNKTYDHLSAVYSALYYAWDALEQSLSSDKDNNNVSDEAKALLNEAQSEKKTILGQYAKLKMKSKNPENQVGKRDKSALVKNKSLKSLSENVDPVPRNSPYKFSCISNDLAKTEQAKGLKMEEDPVAKFKKMKEEMDGTPDPKVQKVGRKGQQWNTNKTDERINATKKRLKSEINKLVREGLSTTIVGCGPISASKQGVLAQFKQQYTNLKNSEDDDFKTHFKVLTDLVDLLDFCLDEAYGKKEGQKKEENEFMIFYKEYAKGSKPTPFFNYTEYYSVIHKKDPAPVDESVKPRLLEFLDRLIPYLEKDLENTAMVEKEKRQSLAAVDVQLISDLISAYFEKLVKIHKNLSHNRFIDLFTAHENFVNRIRYALLKIEDKNTQQDLIQNIVNKTLAPKTILTETSGHRKTQGRHLKDNINENQRDDFCHVHIKRLHAYFGYITTGSSALSKYECAHVVPFPALFVARDLNAFNSSVSLDFMKAGSEERNKMFQEDIDSLFEQHKADLKTYMEKAVELAMKTTLEEVSHTVHTASLFNQRVDGASEKYVKDAGSEELALLKELQAENDKVRARNEERKKGAESTKKEGVKQTRKEKKAERGEPLPYTEKIYKYILSLNMFAMLQESTNGKKEFKDILMNEANYIAAVKKSLAARISAVTGKEKNVINLLMAYTLCNVFFGLKNTEAKAGIDLHEGEEEFFKSIDKLESWMGQELEMSFEESFSNQ